ncbi:MAG: glycosyltransferase [Candidatus Eremiobacteraeota bacterium]|nr:glycosyltransferase [Candidatus Eremiobacteraeota bacterium]
MLFSVVIATRDRSGELTQALDSLQRQAGAPAFEIVVVDNGSADDTKAVAHRYRAAPVPVLYVCEPRPNRARARNRGVAVARGTHLIFCDDDVELPQRWLAAHAAAQRDERAVVNGPILNVQSRTQRPLPRLANFSRAFLCSCNVSLPTGAFIEAGGFDESFDLYGWEDTELGLRLRHMGVTWKFAWDAYLWHIKPAHETSLAEQLRKAVEKARMARRFVAKHPSGRARWATGTHALNLLRARYLLPEPWLWFLAGLATSARVPRWLSAVTRMQLLDGVYTRELFRVPRAD